MRSRTCAADREPLCPLGKLHWCSMNDMRVHYLQHVPFEGPAAIEDWAVSRGHTISGTELYRSLHTPIGTPEEPDSRAILPALEEFDLLVVMGGPMSVHDTEQHPWLTAEKTLIQAAVQSDAAVLGICLGAQLVAEALGGQVTKGPQPEIGWYPVTMTPAGRAEQVFTDLPETFPALHWHGQTFAIPPTAVHAATSAAYPHQAFAYDNGRVVGLQFHLETTPESLSLLADAAAHELDPSPGQKWVAAREEMLSPHAPYAACFDLLSKLLDRMVARIT